MSLLDGFVYTTVGLDADRRRTIRRQFMAAGLERSDLPASSSHPPDVNSELSASCGRRTAAPPDARVLRSGGPDAEVRGVDASP